MRPDGDATPGLAVGRAMPSARVVRSSGSSPAHRGRANSLATAVPAFAIACAAAAPPSAAPAGRQLAAPPAHPPPTATPPAPAPPAATGAPVPPDPQRELAERYASHRPLATLRGQASYYADSLAGRPTASGEPYDPRAYTAAHRTLPFDTVVRVRTTAHARSVYVRINDRGPFGDRRRIIDLSRAAAEALDLLRDGVAPVTVEVLERGGH